MSRTLPGCVAAAMLGAALVAATPAMARGRFGGIHGGFGGGAFHGGMVTGRSVFIPGGNRFAGAPSAGRHAFDNRFHNANPHNFAFRHHRFRTFAFFGVPFAYDYSAHGNGCWRWDGWQWINICYEYGG